MVYGIQSPFTGEVHYPPSGRCWVIPQREAKPLLERWGVTYELRDIKDADARASVIGVEATGLRTVKALMLKTPVGEAKEKASRLLADGPWPQVYFGVKGTGRPAMKRYLEDVKQGRVPMTYWADEDMDDPEVLGSVSWDHEESGHSQTGVDELTAIVGAGHGFETVKPMKLMTKIIQIWCPPNGTVLDLFAGSGALGLEAASRGASDVVLVDSSREAAEVARRNATTLGLPQVRVVLSSVQRYLSGNPPFLAGSPADLVLLDPPYVLTEGELGEVLGILTDGWLADGGVVVVERSGRSPEPRWPQGLQRTDVRRYGETTLWYAAPPAE